MTSESPGAPGPRVYSGRRSEPGAQPSAGNGANHGGAPSASTHLPGGSFTSCSASSHSRGLRHPSPPPRTSVSSSAEQGSARKVVVQGLRSELDRLDLSQGSSTPRLCDQDNY